jgi:N-acyl-D-aspartate/D-glutamate deacylase
MHDLVIRNGTIVDGTGRPAFRGDLAIDGDRIAAVGDVPGTGWRTLDAEGRAVTPGFIDPHTHLDAQVMWDPLGTPACWHGTTTIVLGNCGVTFAPVRPADRERLARTLESVEEIPVESIMASLTWRWESFGEYLDALASHPLGVNAAGFVGHAALRYDAMGEASVDPERTPAPSELARMQERVDEALAAGALGFSTSRTRSHATPERVPIPGTFARDDELFALAGVLAKRGKGVVQWVAGFGENDGERGATAEFPEARREIWRIAETGRRAGRPAIYSLFTHPLVPRLHTLLLEQTALERERGGVLRPMMGPRVGTPLFGLTARSPVRAAAWRELYERPARERLELLEDETWRRRLAEVRPEADAQAGALHLFGPEACDYERRPETRVATVAARAGERPVETILRRMRETRGRQVFAGGGANQNAAHIDEVLAFPGTIVGLGDAGAHVTGMCDSSFPTYVLVHWCRERGTWSLEEGVRRLTSDPADAFGLAGRGRLAPGACADVCVIDYARLAMEVPEFVHDFPAGAGRWTQRARGYDFVIVNGEIAIEGDRHTGRLPGRVLRA